MKKGKTTLHLECGSNGKPLATISNFLAIMEHDQQYQGVRFNELTGQAEIHVITEAGEPDNRDWRDSDDSASREYIERVYKLHNVSKHNDALQLLFKKRSYNPLLDLVESLLWDGENRCEQFLTRWMKAEDSPYTREVSRLIFAGGINRLYHPGCKFDDMPILIGTKQGEGKSTAISWLALKEAYATTTKNLSGDQKSVEAIQGAWIVEVPEMTAFKNAEVEEVKGFVSLTNDKIRLPYDRRTTVLPRRCIFIGTSNTSAVLVDKTGNRRFYPVEVHSDGRELYDHESAVKAYINQCWAEARERFKAGQMPPVADRKLVDLYREAQEDAMVEDYRVGVIGAYLRRQPAGARVCVVQIWSEALFPDTVQKITWRDQRDVAEILDHIPGWERAGRPIFPKYGQQRAWQRTKEAEANMAKDELPF